MFIDHEAYIAYPFEETLGTGFKGHSGHLFYIQMNNGRGLKSNNVWHQGTVPEIIWKDLPDNAKFISKEEFNQLTM